MAYDRYLADKITRVFEEANADFYEKEMMGGITWMVDEKMCINIFKGNLMVRVAPEELDTFLSKKGAAQVVHGGKTMTGYLTIAPEGFDFDEDLEYWIQKCLEFNPRAKASKKRGKSAS